MPLGWKVDDPTRAARQTAEIIDVHFPKPHFTRLASFFIVPKHFREGLLELQSDALPHDALRIHRVHEGLDRGFEQISLSDLDHGDLDSITLLGCHPMAGGSDFRAIVRSIFVRQAVGRFILLSFWYA